MGATLGAKDNSPGFFTALKKLSKQQVYVGIPESSAADRARKLRDIAETITGKGRKAQRKRNRILAMAKAEDVTNAGLLFIHTKGSELKNIPARPVLEPAIEAEDNKDAISAELEGAAQDVLDFKDPTTHLKRAGIAGQRAAQKWFTDPRNGWPQNAPSTLRRKQGLTVNGPTPLYGMSAGLDSKNTPLIDTGAMRAAITYVVKSED